MPPHSNFDLTDAARREMIHEGFDPDFPPEVNQQLASIRMQKPSTNGQVRDLRHLLWSSIDNDTSRDLDQIEYAERVDGAIRVLIGIADVDASVTPHSPIDDHASSQTTSVYTGVRTFPMLPEELSTDLTSLNEDGDRLALVIEMLVTADGTLNGSSVYPAQVRNKAQLTYSSVGAWL